VVPILFWMFWDLAASLARGSQALGSTLMVASLMSPGHSQGQKTGQAGVPAQLLPAVFLKSPPVLEAQRSPRAGTSCHHGVQSGNASWRKNNINAAVLLQRYT
jgi:hypothetical protein